jgi:protein-S-isoprenylcysteine O-methyltransferase Ste14
VTTIVAYALVAAFILIERVLRKGEPARSMQTDAADRGTTYLIGAAFGLTLNGGLVVVLLRRGRDPGRVTSRRVGLGAMVAGLLLRIWAAQTLGRYYTRTLKVVPDQPNVYNEHRGGTTEPTQFAGRTLSLLSWT